MPKVSNLLYVTPAWFDGFYQEIKSKSKPRSWKSIEPENRFDQIVNSAFAIKSEHSSLIQVSDAVSYVYRRHLELTDGVEKWKGEKEYYKKLVARLEGKRKKLGQTPKTSSSEFYRKAKHVSWNL